MKTKVATIFLGMAIGIGSFFLLQRASHTKTIETPEMLVQQTGLIEQAQAFILPVSQITYMPIRDFGIPEPAVNARAAILVDKKSNRILFEKNSGQKLPIASITKLMSAAVILDHLDLDQTYIVAPENINVDGMRPDFTRGEQLRGTELFRLALIQSSNDAISVFETYMKKNGFDLVSLMNKKAEDLGMMNTHFADPAGLDDSGTYSTAADVVALIRYAAQYPLISQALTTQRADIPTLGGTFHHIINTNKLLGVISEIVLGKTGNTEGARGTLALIVDVGDGGDGLISVVLGSEDRFGETKTIIDWGKRAHTWLP